MSSSRIPVPAPCPCALCGEFQPATTTAFTQTKCNLHHYQPNTEEEEGVFYGHESDPVSCEECKILRSVDGISGRETTCQQCEGAEDDTPQRAKESATSLPTTTTINPAEYLLCYLAVLEGLYIVIHLVEFLYVGTAISAEHVFSFIAVASTFLYTLLMVSDTSSKINSALGNSTDADNTMIIEPNVSPATTTETEHSESSLDRDLAVVAGAYILIHLAEIFCVGIANLPALHVFNFISYSIMMITVLSIYTSSNYPDSIFNMFTGASDTKINEPDASSDTTTAIPKNECSLNEIQAKNADYVEHLTFAGVFIYPFLLYLMFPTTINESSWSSVEFIITIMMSIAGIVLLIGSPNGTSSRSTSTNNIATEPAGTSLNATKKRFLIPYILMGVAQLIILLNIFYVPVTNFVNWCGLDFTVILLAAHTLFTFLFTPFKLFTSHRFTESKPIVATSTDTSDNDNITTDSNTSTQAQTEPTTTANTSTQTQTEPTTTSPPSRTTPNISLATLQQTATNYGLHIMTARSMSLLQERITAAEAAVDRARAEGFERSIQEIQRGTGRLVEEARLKEREEGIVRGRGEGLEEGMIKGRIVGFAEGRRRGFELGREKGFEQGREKGRQEGKKEALREEGWDVVDEEEEEEEDDGFEIQAVEGREAIV